MRLLVVISPMPISSVCYGYVRFGSFVSLSEKEIGTGLVFVNIPGSLKEATTQEALQRGTVLAISWKGKPVDGSDVVDILGAQHSVKNIQKETKHTLKIYTESTKSNISVK